MLTKNLDKDFDTALTKGREKGTKQTTTCTTFATMARLRVGKRLSTRELEIHSLKRELQILVMAKVDVCKRDHPTGSSIKLEKAGNSNAWCKLQKLLTLEKNPV